MRKITMTTFKYLFSATLRLARVTKFIKMWRALDGTYTVCQKYLTEVMVSYALFQPDAIFGTTSPIFDLSGTSISDFDLQALDMVC